MTAALLFVFASTCGLLLVSGLQRRGGIYGFSFAAGCVMLGFMLPQFIGLATLRDLPAGAVDKTLVMATLVAAMCWAGSAAGDRPMATFMWHLDERRLGRIGMGLTLAGAYFYYAISRLPPELLETSQWTGLPVAYLFFARLLTYGLLISLLVFLRNGSRLALAAVVIGASFYLFKILIGGRRADTAELFYFVFLGLWFVRGWALPRAAMLGAAIAGMLFINSIGPYRGAAIDGITWEEIVAIDYVGNLTTLAEEGGAEVMNAVYVVAAVDATMQVDYGAFQWNRLVHSYVPAQLVGAELKQAFMLPEEAVAFDEFMHTAAPGSTFTGLSDSFRSFWYFGCVLFFGFAYLLQRLYRSAMAGSLPHQVFYALLMTPALHTLTHHTASFTVVLPHMAAFLVPALMLARRPQRRRAALPVPPTFAIDRREHR